MFFEKKELQTQDVTPIIPLKCILESEKDNDKGGFINHNRISSVKEYLGDFDYNDLKNSY